MRRNLKSSPRTLEDAPLQLATLGGLPQPIGEVTVLAVGDTLVGVAFGDHAATQRTRCERRHGPAHRVPEAACAPARALRRYFGGDVKALETLRVAPDGTPFQQRVWRALRRIPAGRTVSYGQLAASLGAPTAARAVASANAANPVPVVVPCHRVIAADGSLCGFSSGVERKEWLLMHEGCPVARRAKAGAPPPSAS